MKHISHYQSLIYGVLFSLLTLVLWLADGAIDTTTSNTIVITQSDTDTDEEALDDARSDSEDSEQIRELIRQAIAESKAGKKQTALQRYQQILLLNPNHQKAAINAAILSKSLFGCSIASVAIDNAIDLNRGQRLAKALSLQASCLMEDNQPAEAIVALNRAIEFFPNHALLWKKLAQAQQQQSVPDTEQIITLQRALALDREDQPLRLQLAEKQLQALDFRGAIETIKADYKRLKRDYQAQYLLSWSYLELDMPNNAEKHIRLAKRLDKSKSDFLRAMLAYSDKKYSQSLEILKAQFRRQRTGRYLMAMNFLKKGWPKSTQNYLQLLLDKPDFKARAQLRQWQLLYANTPADTQQAALQQLLDDGYASSYIGELGAQLALQQHTSAQASEQALAWLKDTPFPSASPLSNRLYLQALWGSGAQAQVLSLLRQYTSSDPRRLRLFAHYLSKAQQPAEALEQLSRIHPSDRQLDDYHTMAELALISQQPQVATELLTEATEIYPQSIDIRLQLAKVLVDQQPQRSKQQVQLALKLNPEHQAAQTFLAENF